MSGFSRPRVYVPNADQIQASLIDRADRNRDSHSPGWPHFDRKGNCLCLGACCVSTGGCRCRECTHRSHQ